MPSVPQMIWNWLPSFKDVWMWTCCLVVTLKVFTDYISEQVSRKGRKRAVKKVRLSDLRQRSPEEGQEQDADNEERKRTRQDHRTLHGHQLIFNTNNIWANLEAIKRVVEKRELEMEIIVNPKHLDQGVDVIQLETAAGAAVKNFKGACGITVPRSRFLPVEKTSDLLLLMSNLYDIDSGNLTLSSLRSFPATPVRQLESFRRL
uniref:UTP--glucose-1-phosphate uridylyltransferase n=1 Tax=Ditylenchus dipsaci TaxID=166011 RepID=A0A915CX03_9BILA